MIALITLQELQGLTDQELGEMHQHFLMLLTASCPDTDRCNILATLENIERTLGQPTSSVRGPRFAPRP